MFGRTSFHGNALAPELQSSTSALSAKLDRNAILHSRSLDLLHSHLNPSLGLEQYEYQVFSQFGDDGIISFLSKSVPPDQRLFIEFGVEDYQEANTILLLKRDNWSGLVIDASKQQIESIRKRSDFWRYNLTCVEAFIKQDNINQLFLQAGFQGPIGLLSIDIDGNDYWIWQAITVVDPCIVVCEYNSIFGPSATVTIPYHPEFSRLNAHYSGLYAGTSLAALEVLAGRKGYRLVGSNSAGNNAYFCRNDFALHVPTRSSGECYVSTQFREGRNPNGELLYQTAGELKSMLADLPVYDIQTQTTIPFQQVQFDNV